MKHFYSLLFKAIIYCSIYMAIGKGSNAQSVSCPLGYIADSLGYDTTINFSSGRLNTDIKFPKFDPTTGMVTCARLTMTMTGTLNTLQFENIDNTTNTASATFNRHDTITGPGLSSSLKNAESKFYGTYSLDPADATMGSGPDYVHVGPEQIFSKSVSVLLTDTTDLSIFYGPVGDSLTYHYSVNSQTNTSVTGNWLGGVVTTGSITYRIDFCYCPSYLLPLNIKQFFVNKIGADRAELTWSGFDEPNVNYHYEIEMSRNGFDFSDIASRERITSSENNTYTYDYASGRDAGGTYFFRIKQVYGNGYTRYTDVKSVNLNGSSAPRFSVYPNPSTGIVGIKFDNVSTGNYLVQIINTQGQTVTEKEMQLSGSTYREITSLQRGVYWLRLTDVTSQLSSVNQLLIK